MTQRPSATTLLLAAALLAACGDSNGPRPASCLNPVLGAPPAGTTHPTLTSVEHVPLGGTPFGVAVAPTGTVLVTRFHAATAAVARLPATSFAAPFDVGPLPSQVRMHPSGQTAYVNNQDAGTVTFVDVTTSLALASPRVTTRSILTLGLSPDGERLYALTDYAGVIVIDTDTRAVIDSMTGIDSAAAGTLLTGVAFHPFFPCMYVAARDEGKVRTVDMRTHTVVRTDSVPGGRLQNLAVSRDGAELYATDIERSKLVIWDLESRSRAFQTVAVGAAVVRNAFDVAVTPDNAQVYVSTLAEGRIYVFDRATRAPFDTIDAGGSARYIAFTGNGAGVVVPNEAGWVTFSPASPIPAGPCVPPQTGNPPGGAGHPALVNRETVPLAGTPFGVAVSTAGVVYVTQLAIASVVRADLPATTFGTPFPVGPLPSQIRMHPDGQTAYVGNQDARTITLVNVGTNQPFDTVAVPGGSILTIGLSPDGSRLYALTDFTGVYIIDTGTRAIVGSIPAGITGDLLTGVAFHPFAPCAYLAARDAGVVTVVNTQTLGFVRSYPVAGGRIQNVAVSRDGYTLFGTDIQRSKLITWDLTSGSAAFQERAIGTAGSQLAFDVAVTPDNAQVYVSALGNGRVYVFDRTSGALLDSVVTGGAARYIGFRPDGTFAVISNEAGWVNFLR